MYIELTEEEKDAICDLGNAIIECVDKLKEMLNEICECFSEIIEEIKDNIGAPTNTKYKLVKFLSKCTGIDKKVLWHKMYVRRARSNC